MVKTHRNKLVSLTKVRPKARDHKQVIVQRVHALRKRFNYVYVLGYQNMTTRNFKVFRESLPDCKFLFGKNRVMQIAFGRDEASSHQPNSFKISRYLIGRCCLFFTNRPKAECEKLFKHYEEAEFATGGALATSTIVLPAGKEALKKFTHSMEPYLRQLGLATRLINSQIELQRDFLVAEEGKPLTVEQCKILKLLEIKVSAMKFNIKAFYDGKHFKAR